MSTPAFLDTRRPDVPNLVVPRGVTPFYLRGSPVRGRLIRLGHLADLLLSRRDDQPAVLALGGEALALVAGLSSALKFKGSFSLQIKGDGPIASLVTDCTDTGDLRLYVRSDKDTHIQSPAKLLGEGYFAFTIDQGAETDRHQGIVSIEGQTLAEMAMHYFDTSEQHPCWIELFCDMTDTGWQAGGLILERIASEGGIRDDSHDITEDTWQTACILAETMRQDEIFDETLDSRRLITRLFGTLGVEMDQPRALAYGCRCSRARLASLLATFPPDDIDHMSQDGTVTMTCEFCDIDFHFSQADISGAHSQDV
ncbi:Hsp33 family molecular chaperone HslO [Brytella acorum]|uniref:Hsp33 family molecular chaperone HslO n=1 Tax=Brytella acorum TaxID=2959299 RepID=A0AA35UWZ4_9PROT|nr:Hsp33 family molecular chaperone HslO [Brytella acorum]MDF3625105.1 Hsp33 family molecular chaperone HslO [Brytella acorum]CAI9121016.1 Hsp33 family molecular chaperone HslO [Brytella acorum]